MSGFSPPNHTQCPNDLFDVHMANMSEAELRIVLAAVRKTLGYHKTKDAISLSQFMKMTGLARQSVIRGIEAAIKHGFIKQVGEGTRGIAIFELNINDNGTLVNVVDQSTEVTSSSLPTLPMTGKRSRHTKESGNKIKEKKNAPKVAVVSDDAIQECLTRSTMVNSLPTTFSRWKEKEFNLYYTAYREEMDALLIADGIDVKFQDWLHLPIVSRKMYVSAHREFEIMRVAPEQYGAVIKYTRDKWSDAPLSEVIKNTPKFLQIPRVNPYENSTDKPKPAHELSSYELQKMQHEGADFEWQ